MKDPYTGSCLCGSLCYEIKGEPITVYNCHCTECQKVGASAFGMSVRVDSGDFSITSGDYKKIKTISDSGSSKTGFFCPDQNAIEIDIMPPSLMKMNIAA